LAELNTNLKPAGKAERSVAVLSPAADNLHEQKGPARGVFRMRGALQAHRGTIDMTIPRNKHRMRHSPPITARDGNARDRGSPLHRLHRSFPNTIGRDPYEDHRERLHRGWPRPLWVKSPQARTQTSRD
jgi:hypothetical protein